MVSSGSSSQTRDRGSRRRITSGSSTSSTRPTRAHNSTRERGSASRCQSDWSSCTAGTSGSTASSAREARSCSRCRWGPRSVAGDQILVVEDNEKNMMLFRDVLEATGYRLLEATTGEQAVELAATHSPNLVLMDIQLPDIDGVEALGRLRGNERTASIPVVALTAQAMQDDRKRFLDAGFDGYISKPVDVVEFVKTVKEYLRKEPS